MLSFIDVSGDPYARPDKSPWIAVSAINLRKSCLDEVNQTMHRLKRDVLGNERIELKATDLVNPSTLNNPELCKAKYLDKLFLDCIDRVDCLCAAVVFPNSGNNQKSSNERLPRHYRDLLWRVEAACRQVHAQDTLVILDNDSRRIDKDLAFAFNNYMYRTQAGNTVLRHIISVPIFADSEMTAGLQLADIVSGILRQYYSRGLHNTPPQQNDTEFLRKLREYTAIINRRAVRSIRLQEFTISGLYVPPCPYDL